MTDDLCSKVTRLLRRSMEERMSSKLIQDNGQLIKNAQEIFKALSKDFQQELPSKFSQAHDEWKHFRKRLKEQVTSKPEVRGAPEPTRKTEELRTKPIVADEKAAPIVDETDLMQNRLESSKRQPQVLPAEGLPRSKRGEEGGAEKSSIAIGRAKAADVSPKATAAPPASKADASSTRVKGPTASIATISALLDSSTKTMPPGKAIEPSVAKEGRPAQHKVGASDVGTEGAQPGQQDPLPTGDDVRDLVIKAFIALLQQCPKGDLSAAELATRQEARVFAKHSNRATTEYKREMKRIMLTLTGPALRAHVMHSKRSLL
mmetsp:Transcript_3975/g.14123  ORF Transcript_3975/g.14123 Transcript_3975/m.14123 type:complete len:318 (-) Transcript_3975:1326-2279(-)